MEYTCNLCLKYFPTTVQIMAHAASVHKRNYQYHCPYCEFGGNLATALIEHILREHPEREVQPVQIYQRIVCKNKQTLGFYCTTCHEVASSFQKIAMHCDKEHKSRNPVQCPHCIFGHLAERQVVLHIQEKHPHERGLAMVQFERVLNDIPNSISWEIGRPIEVEPEKEIPNNGESAFLPLSQRQVVTEVVDLLDSDDEADEYGEQDDAVSKVWLMQAQFSILFSLCSLLFCYRKSWSSPAHTATGQTPTCRTYAPSTGPANIPTSPSISAFSRCCSAPSARDLGAMQRHFASTCVRHTLSGA